MIKLRRRLKRSSKSWLLLKLNPRFLARKVCRNQKLVLQQLRRPPQRKRLPLRGKQTVLVRVNARRTRFGSYIRSLRVRRLQELKSKTSQMSLTWRRIKYTSGFGTPKRRWTRTRRLPRRLTLVVRRIKDSRGSRPVEILSLAKIVKDILWSQRHQKSALEWMVRLAASLWLHSRLRQLWKFINLRQRKKPILNLSRWHWASISKKWLCKLYQNLRQQTVGKLSAK